MQRVDHTRAGLVARTPLRDCGWHFSDPRGNPAILGLLKENRQPLGLITVRNWHRLANVAGIATLSGWDGLSADELRAAKAVGLTRMSFGLESGSRRLNDSMAKGTSIDGCRDSSTTRWTRASACARR